MEVLEATGADSYNDPQAAKERSIVALRKLGYAFNDAGIMCKVDKRTDELTDQPFEFNVYNDQALNEENYQQIAALIPDIIYDLLEKQGLQRVYIPEGAPKELATFFFADPVPLKHPKKLLVLIHGSGYVKAGQWARSLIISNSIDIGSQLPYIRRAQSLGYSILVMNTNDTSREINGKLTPIPGVSSAKRHAEYVWEHFVVPCQPESVAIVAHSFGGAVTMNLIERFAKFFREHVFALAFTDSVHGQLPKNMQTWVTANACNYVRSNDKAGTEMQAGADGVKRLSAGHIAHEWTSYAAMEEVFKFLEQKYARSIDSNEQQEYSKKRRRSP